MCGGSGHRVAGAEGGLQSVLWAGPETLGGARRGHQVEGTHRKGPVSLLLGYASAGSEHGGDLAAATQTIVEVGDAAGLQDSISDAFDGARVEVLWDGGFCEVAVRQPGMLRPLRAAELSDGTIRYLLLVAALHTPRPPELMVLNEPETSLHPDLVPPLARLLAGAARHTQIVVVTHSGLLLDALAQAGPATLRDELRTITLTKQLGETRIEGQRP